MNYHKFAPEKRNVSKPMSEQMQKLADRYEQATGKKFCGKTNADKIRSMTDEELVNVVPCPLGFSMFRCPIERQCGTCKREWLKQPVEEDDYEQ